MKTAYRTLTVVPGQPFPSLARPRSLDNLVVDFPVFLLVRSIRKSSSGLVKSGRIPPILAEAAGTNDVVTPLDE
jgi:hypothetical protein